MDDVSKYKDVLFKCDYLIHVATVWGYDLDVNIRINKDRWLEMLDCLKSRKNKKNYLLFNGQYSHPKNRLSEFAKTVGTPYVKSKYEGYCAHQTSPLADKIVTLFPTVVLGGSDKHPYSHISQGLLNIHDYINWGRHLKVPGSFHFLHSVDIAKMVTYPLYEKRCTT